MIKDNVQFSRSVSAGKKKYYLDVRKAKNGSNYLSIRETSEGDTPEQKESRRILMFDQAIADFTEAFSAVSSYMQKAKTEKAGV